MKKFLLALVLSTVAATSSIHAQATINTTTNWDGSRQIGMFGALPAATVYGQIFTMPVDNNLLDDFSFWLDPHPVWLPNIVFRAYVMEWDSRKAIGPVLWESAEMQGPTSYMQKYTFYQNGLRLKSGHQYVAFLSTIGEFNQFPTNAQVLMGYSDASYSGGHFVNDINDANFSDLTTHNWSNNLGACPTCSAAFIANFRMSIVRTNAGDDKDDDRR